MWWLEYWHWRASIKVGSSVLSLKNPAMDEKG